MSEIKVNLPAKTNNEDCPWGNNFEVEQQFFLGLNAATSYRILGNVLQIPYGEGDNIQVLNFVATQPPVEGEALDLTPLQGTSWCLSAIGDNQIISGSEITAGDTPIVRYDWEMGDGTLLNGAVVQYAYNNAGGYTVKLTVTDQAGQKSETTKSVQISPVVEVTPPTAVIEGPAMAFVGDPVTFSAANSQQGTAAITSYQWQSGDGNNSGAAVATPYAAPAVAP